MRARAMGRVRAASLLVFFLIGLPAIAETAFDRGRRQAAEAIMANAVVACLYKEKWINDDQVKETLDYYQRKHGVSDKVMSNFINHPNYDNAVGYMISSAGGCEKLLDNVLISR